MSTSLALDRGRTAAATRRWQDAFRALEIADAESALALDDLESLALAAYLTGREDASTTLWARAHREELAAGDQRPASATWPRPRRVASARTASQAASVRQGCLLQVTASRWVTEGRMGDHRPSAGSSSHPHE